jgi:2,4-dienoyl-CoA reductase-like NADH-dependent reductase (Old Yellow Enzyme family)
MPESLLFSPIKLAGITFPNRIFVSPMCQYSSADGFASDWHLVHLGSRAVGGASLVMTEASAVHPGGRISPRDLGIWKDEHIPNLKRIVSFLHSQGARAGTQLAHAGRKASTTPPWQGNHTVTPEEGGWPDVWAPSAISFSKDYPKPFALDLKGIRRIAEAFQSATQRALRIGFDVIEIHAAHGYLLHEFLSPLTNHRTDHYGGSFENRTRLLLEVVDGVREYWPIDKPLFVRISATDWVEGGWDLPQSVELAKLLKTRGVELVDVSSGGAVAQAQIPVGPGYQTPFSEEIRKVAGIPTGAVGMITSPAQAEHILRSGQADAVLLAREFLRDPYFPLHAAKDLGHSASWPVQYLRASDHGSVVREGLEASDVEAD